MNKLIITEDYQTSEELLLLSNIIKRCHQYFKYYATTLKQPLIRIYYAFQNLILCDF